MAMKICRVNVEQQTSSCEDVPEPWVRLGGRGLIARILLDEVPPACEPLGPNNKLIFTPGLLVGHMLSSCDRLSIGGKSPLTGGVKESNAGGSTGMALALLGFHALIFEGWPTDSSWWVVVISQDGVRFDPAEDLIGLGVYASAARLIERYGEKVALSLIGPGGEMQLLAAGIQNLDKDRVPSRINARGGLGAVMGSKHIKAVVFDTAGTSKPPIADPAAFKAAQKTFTQALMAHPQTAAYRDYGTAGMARMCNSLGALPTRNFSSGQFESVETISGEHMREALQQRGGASETTHACMAGCTIRCSNVYADPQGKEIVSPLEYETIGLMGSNLGLTDLDDVARLNWQANDLGLDTIDLGAALGVAADAGVLAFGDAQRALELMDEIRAGTPLGRLLGGGAALTGKALGVRRVPVVKNQAISAYDPRAIKGTGVTYATTPQGADHTCGLTIRAKVDHTNPEGQAALSRTAQINMAGYDTLGACIFAGFGFAVVPETIPALINARYGWGVPPDFLQVLGRQTIELEKEFNRRAGFTPADDRLPEWMTQEPLTPTGAVFDVPAEDLDQVHNW
ncbi:aldehyde:ferredoxin oxidoreductase [Levilinea saccharolytica]|uniref:Aldehyde:ferredoxin oxidoreductase n=2 Tax=Levilinea saccharolytica TaxID=229921 RepID=A0A0P6YQ02_9CHLR|nr:aldehyde:ferredoxin oxidoreductase [Levilinea saccharolytica]